MSIREAWLIPAGARRLSAPLATNDQAGGNFVAQRVPWSLLQRNCDGLRAGGSLNSGIVVCLPTAPGRIGVCSLNSGVMGPDRHCGQEYLLSEEQSSPRRRMRVTGKNDTRPFGDWRSLCRPVQSEQEAWPYCATELSREVLRSRRCRVDVVLLAT